MELVQEAMKRKVEIRYNPHRRTIVGVDPARFGADQTVIVVRQDRVVLDVLKYRELDTMEIASIVMEVFRKYSNNSVICVDGVGIGAGVVDALNHRGVPVIDVQSAAKSLDIRTYANRRAELYGKLKEWLQADAVLPNDKDLSNQLAAIEYAMNRKLQIQLKSKDDIRKELGSSPDISDALAYTFAYEEMVSHAYNQRPRRIRTELFI